MDDCTISREREAERVIFHLAGSFDRAGAWDLRARLDGEATPEVLLDFSLVREFSDLGLAVVAHGLIAGSKHVHFRRCAMRSGVVGWSERNFAKPGLDPSIFRSLSKKVMRPFGS